MSLEISHALQVGIEGLGFKQGSSPMRCTVEDHNIAGRVVNGLCQVQAASIDGDARDLRRISGGHDKGIGNH